MAIRPPDHMTTNNVSRGLPRSFSGERAFGRRDSILALVREPYSACRHGWNDNVERWLPAQKVYRFVSLPFANLKIVPERSAPAVFGCSIKVPVSVLH